MVTLIKSIFIGDAFGLMAAVQVIGLVINTKLDLIE
jgi:hypothetical protein